MSWKNIESKSFSFARGLRQNSCTCQASMQPSPDGATAPRRRLLAAGAS